MVPPDHSLDRLHSGPSAPGLNRQPRRENLMSYANKANYISLVSTYVQNKLDDDD